MSRSVHRRIVLVALSALTLVLCVSASVSAGAPASSVLSPVVTSSGTCAIPFLTAPSGVPGTVVDCATVHVSGQGVSTSQDTPSGSVVSSPLADHGWLSSDIVGTCVGCDTPFGAGAGYQVFMRLQDPVSGEFISVGLIHDNSPLATGDDATGLTFMVETGRMVGNSLDIQHGYLSSTVNRVPGGRATIRLSWTDNGVDVSLDGIIPPGEKMPRTLAVGTFAVQLTHPVASFGATTKVTGDRVDTTFSTIAAG